MKPDLFQLMLNSVPSHFRNNPAYWILPLHAVLKDSRKRRGRTLLHTACKCIMIDDTIVQMIIDAGDDVNQADNVRVYR